MSEKFWMQIPYSGEVAERLYESSLNISFPICVMLAQREIQFRSDAERFLWPKLSHLEDPFRIKNVDQAVDILCRIIANKLNVAIVGDYDVDGITSVILMTNVLKNFGVISDFFVPKRSCEGYGLSSEIIERAFSQKKYDVVIALDCGTSSFQTVEILKNNGIEVLIIDHHRTNPDSIAQCCIVNPHIHDTDDIKYQMLCSVGLVFKVCSALIKTLRKRNDKRAESYSIKNDLDLVALGTIADMSHILQENRIFCKFGLKILSSENRRPGIEALCRAAEISIGTEIQQKDVSFKLCPRLNACGRLTDAVLPISMMLSDDFEEAMTYAYELEETNKERQLIEREITEQANSLVEASYVNDAGLVLYNKNWHAGVVGIISGKLTRDYDRPCVVLGHERGLAKGSCRTENDIDLIDIFEECKESLEDWGGHKHAVGVSILPKNIDSFRMKFNEVIARGFSKVQKARTLDYALELSLEEINVSFASEIEILQPFGQKNAEPNFLLRDMKIGSLPKIFGAQKKHIKFWLVDRYSRKMLVIGWSFSDNAPPVYTPLDFIVKVSKEKVNKSNYVRLTMISWRVSQKISLQRFASNVIQR